ncbi:uncharacterized protein LOC106770412 [Vigna radiata var. radiata]|uniref:Uncharacterized protein LOC106770412 n=1 Tax=Vigna radiata var. radiata TaxID=3916 RepID=A0A1S3V0M5_VIGRR|nr:uncharacterized protein LOC106770412 [Vigna radiata var. radiata]
MIDQFDSITHPFIVDVVDVVANGHCGYRCIAALLGLGEDSWPVIRNDLYKELGNWRDEYGRLVGGTDVVDKLKQSLLVEPQSTGNMNKWMTLPDIGYAIANRYNVILVKLQEGCPLPMVTIISSTHCYPQARAWSSMYTSRMQKFSKKYGVIQFDPLVLVGLEQCAENVSLLFGNLLNCSEDNKPSLEIQHLETPS